jgi:hypothetical protein
MKEIVLWILDKLISITPGLILRLFYSPKKVSSQVRVSLYGEKPINPSLASSVPHIDIYLEITNLSNLELLLDRMLIDLWVGQPLLIGAILKPTKISSRSTGHQVFFRSFLSLKQIQQIEPFISETPPAGGVSLSINAFFESKVGIIETEERFQRQRI